MVRGSLTQRRGVAKTTRPPRLFAGREQTLTGIIALHFCPAGLVWL